MSWHTATVEATSLAIACFAIWRQRRRGNLPALLSLACAGWLAEETSMSLYAYYGYGDAWLLMLHRTPLAVALVWPLVILSSLEVIERTRLGRAGGGARGHLLAAAIGGLLVVYDALVIEPVATRVGLWWWKGGSYFGVPLLGPLGWGIFGAVATLALRCFPPRPRGWGGRPLWLAALIAAGTQALLAPLALGSLRLGLRVPLSETDYAWGVGLLAVLLCPLALALRPHVEMRFRDLEIKVAGSALFFAIIYAMLLWPFWLFCSFVPLPYLCLTLRRGRGPSASQAGSA